MSPVGFFLFKQRPNEMRVLLYDPIWSSKMSWALALSLNYAKNALISFYLILTLYPTPLPSPKIHQRKSALAMGSKSLWGRERPSICSPFSLLFPIKPLQGSARRSSGGSRRLTGGLDPSHVGESGLVRSRSDWGGVSLALGDLERLLCALD